MANPPGTESAGASGGGLQALGWLVLVVGAGWLIYATTMSMTIERDFGAETYNIGLVADKLIHLMMSSFTTLAGLVMIVSGVILGRFPAPAAVAAEVSPDGSTVRCASCGVEIPLTEAYERQGAFWCNNHYPATA